MELPVRAALALLVLVAIGCHSPMPKASLIAQARASTPMQPPTLQECIVGTAIAEIGTKETGFNEGPRIVEYQASTSAAPKTPYCASGDHWVYRQCGLVLEPHWEFAAAARWAKEKVVFKKGQLDMYWHDDEHGHDRISADADVMTLYYSRLGRVGHVEIVIGEDEDNLITVGFNTGSGGEREGEGVFKRLRDKETVWTVNRWWD